MKISEFRLDRAIVGAFILVVGTYFAFTHNVKNANAVVNASGLTGKYGCMMNRNGAGYGALWQGQNGIATSLVSYVDFSNNTSQGMLTLADSFNTTSVVTKTEKFTTTFTEEAIQGVTSAYKVTNTVTNSDGSNGGTATFISVVVNSGNTLLMTQVEENRSKATWSGVCQKI